jgi:hypothetical protein
VGGAVDATNVSLTISGASSHAVVASGGSINLIGGSITTTNTFALGLQANSNAGPATITVDGTTIKTSGAASSGADAEGANNATIDLTKATIITTGDFANGLIAIGSGKTITTTNTNITTSGSSASGATAFNGAQIEVTGGTIMTSGDSAAGLAVGTLPGTSGVGAINVVSLDNTKVITLLGDGVDWDGQADANITLLNGTTVESESGFLLRGLSGPGGTVLNLIAEESVKLIGDISVAATSNGNVFLEKHSTLTGAVNVNSLTGASGSNPAEPTNGQPPTPATVNLDIDSTSTWNMRASSAVIPSR